MRYFLDTEFNGFGGDLISLALVPEYGDQEYYVVVPLEVPPEPWVERHVMPYLERVPPGTLNRLDRIAAAHDVAAYLSTDDDPVIVDRHRREPRTRRRERAPRRLVPERFDRRHPATT